MNRSSSPLVEILSKPDCHLCEEAKDLLMQLRADHAFTLREINIAEREDLLARYGEEIPVVFINGRKAFKYRVEEKKFVRLLKRAQGKVLAALWPQSWRK